jgi:hypothetical protein
LDQQIQNDIIWNYILNIRPYPASTSSTDLTSNRRYTASSGSSSNNISLSRTVVSTSRDYSSISSRPPRASSVGLRLSELTSTRLGSVRSNNNDDVISLEPFSSSVSSGMDTGTEASDRRSTLRFNPQNSSVDIMRINPNISISATQTTQTKSIGSAPTVPNMTLPETETLSRTREEIYRRSARLLNANHLPLWVQSRKVNSPSSSINNDVPLVPSFNTVSNTNERESAIEILRNKSNRPLQQTNTSSTNTNPTTTTTTNQLAPSASASSRVRSTTSSNSKNSNNAKNNNNNSPGAQSPPPLIRARANFLSPTIFHQSHLSSSSLSSPSSPSSPSGRSTASAVIIISDDENEDVEGLFSFALNSLNRPTNHPTSTAAATTNDTKTSVPLLSAENSNNPARIDSRELNERRSDMRRDQINNERRILRDRLRQATRNPLDKNYIKTTTRAKTVSSNAPSTTNAPTTIASTPLIDCDTNTFGAAAASTATTTNNSRDRNIFFKSKFSDYPSPNSSNSSISSDGHVMNVSGSRFTYIPFPNFFLN